MKFHKFTWFFCLLCTAALSFSCDDENESEEPYLTVATAFVNVGSTEGSFDIEVKSNTAWTASSSDEWISISLAEGKGDATVTCTYAGNSTTEQRSAKISVTDKKGETSSYSITVLQKGVSSGGGTTPTPTSGAKYSGWAELPAQLAESDYHYAYHMRADASTIRNFSVCYSASKMCPVWVAAPMHDSYTGSSGRTNAYQTDPDIDCTQAGKWTGYTRGHMLGSSERTVSAATNRQVFYYSNIAPQLGQPYFNTGGGAWNTLEDWVDTQWQDKADTTYQIIGCYWANNNTKVGSTTIPTHYYKILLRTKNHVNKWVVNCSSDELQCIAIMVEHRTYSSNEVAKPSEYFSRGMLHTVAEMEQMTGFTFFPNVPNAPKGSYSRSDWGL